MSSDNQSKNVTIVSSTSKKVVTMDDEGFITTARVSRVPRVPRVPKSAFSTSTKTTKADTNSSEVSSDQVEPKMEAKQVSATVKTQSMATPSNGKGYLAATMKSIPMAPKKETRDDESVETDSTDSSEDEATTKKLDFTETNEKQPNDEQTNDKASNNGWTTVTHVKKYAPKKYVPYPKKADGDSNTHHSSRAPNAYTIALRAAEDNFIQECLPTDKERIAKVVYEIGKIRNHNATVHEVSFANDFDPVDAGGKQVSFSRAKFAQNSFFIKRLKSEYYKLFPTAEWVSIKESTRADKPDTLYVRVGSRE